MDIAQLVECLPTVLVKVSVAALETMTKSIDPGYSPLSEAKARP